eukprot:GILK01010238.1.p1 GENE.GILK01010238.1~~GILK01010238.1.p1  ORF type:complete len:460 (+),score=73.53 GILK01010238.1:67-1446(+)
MTSQDVAAVASSSSKKRKTDSGAEEAYEMLSQQTLSILREQNIVPDESACVFLSTVVDKLAQQLLKSVVGVSQRSHKRRIEPRDIIEALQADNSLQQLVSSERSLFLTSPPSLWFLEGLPSVGLTTIGNMLASHEVPSFFFIPELTPPTTLASRFASQPQAECFNLLLSNAAACFQAQQTAVQLLSKPMLDSKTIVIERAVLASEAICDACHQLQLLSDVQQFTLSALSNELKTLSYHVPTQSSQHASSYVLYFDAEPETVSLRQQSHSVPHLYGQQNVSLSLSTSLQFPMKSIHLLDSRLFHSIVQRSSERRDVIVFDWEDGGTADDIFSVMIQILAGSAQPPSVTFDATLPDDLTSPSLCVYRHCDEVLTAFNRVRTRNKKQPKEYDNDIQIYISQDVWLQLSSSSPLKRVVMYHLSCGHSLHIYRPSVDPPQLAIHTPREAPDLPDTEIFDLSSFL